MRIFLESEEYWFEDFKVDNLTQAISELKAGIVWKKGFECNEVIPLNEGVPGPWFSNRQLLVAFEQAERYLPVMTNNCFLSYPIESRHLIVPNEANNLVPGI